ncbi:hypothetical protein [Terriglobus sp. ADX1]|uniref:hypothetical protein n=1 Tax=Terriglobus sp. ADX1 TaxID=2794063 RepID=UPI002FE6A4CD
MAARIDRFLLALPRLSMLILYCVLPADILTMVVMNLVRVRTSLLPVVFLLALLLSWRLQPVVINRTTGALAQKDQIVLLRCAGVLALLCCLARVAYIIEPLRHSLMRVVVWDDLWHIQEINSLVHSASYPAVSSFNSHAYLSFYYAAWMLPSALYVALPVSFVTIKSVFAVATIFYTITSIFSLIWIMLYYAESRSQAFGAAYLFGLYAGIESLFSLVEPLRHHAIWMFFIGLRLNYPSFVTLLLWVIHHLLAAVALLLAAHLWGCRDRHLASLLHVALLVVFAFYSSVFVVLGALPLGLLLAYRDLRSRFRDLVLITLQIVLLALPILWIYLGKRGSVGFLVPLHPDFHLVIAPLHWSIPLGLVGGFFLFCILLALNFLPQIIILVKARSRIAQTDGLILVLVALFLLSTYWIGYSLFNNYCMRGSIIPLMLLSWISARYLQRLRFSKTSLFVLAIGAAASVNEIAICDAAMLHSLVQHSYSYGRAGREILDWNEQRSLHEIDLDALQQIIKGNDDLYYHVEKLSPKVSRLPNPSDIETENAGPFGIWRFERHRD